MELVERRSRSRRSWGCRPRRSKRIDDIYTRRSEDLKPIGDEFLKQSGELEKMTRARVVDETTYSLQVMRVESARSS